MDLYGVLLFFHVLGAALWMGGVAIYYVLITRMNSMNDRGAMRGLMSHAEKVGFAYFMPAALTTLIAGIALVLKGDWEWSEPFVLVGLVGIALTIVVGAVVSTAREKAFIEVLERPDASDADIRTVFLPVRAIARMDLALLLVIIFFMTVKPGT